MKYEKLNIEIINENFFDRIEELEDYIELYNGDTLQFTVYKNSNVRASNNSTMYTFDSSKVYAYDSSTIYAHNSSIVYACNSSIVYAYDSSKTYAYDNATIHASDHSTLYAYNSSTVYAYYSSTVVAYDFSTLYIYNSKVTINANNHFGAIIKQVFKIKKDILVYKKLRDEKIATLKLVKGQTFQSEHFYKCRTDRAIVVEITNIDNTEEYQNGVSMRNSSFIYEVGKEVIANRYDENIEECSNGIHFFLTREKAVEYNL